MSRNIIAKQFQSFIRSIYRNPTAPEFLNSEQYKQIRDAFYVGAASMYGAITGIDTSAPESESVAVLESLNAELDEFCFEVATRSQKGGTNEERNTKAN